MSRFRQITLLKVLAAVAWADGEITNSELNVLKNLYLHFGLDKRDIDQVQPYIRAPLPPKEQTALFRQLADELSTEASRKEAMQALEEMARADNQLKDEERTLLEEFSRLVEASSITRRSLGKIRNLFKRTLVKPPRETAPEMISYFQQVLAKQFEVKSKGKSKIDIADPKVYLMCLLGTLLSSVAQVDNQLDETEKKALRKILKERYSLEKKELDMVFEVIVEQARRGYDFDEVTKEFNRIATYNDRLHCVDMFFAVSSADGDMSHDETEEIRRITKALRVPHKVFIDRKMEALNKLRGEMMVRTEQFAIETKGFGDILDITESVTRGVSASGIASGIATVFVPGSTAGITTIEFESGAVSDLKQAIDRMAPENLTYQHDLKWGDGNGFSHVRAALMGASCTVPVNQGRLLLGTWQQIVLCDFDNRPRRRDVLVQVMGDA